MSVPTLKQAPLQEHTRILGLGAYRPDVIVTNEDVCQWIDSSDEWIRQRTGIVTRHRAAADVSVIDMAEGAAREAMEKALRYMDLAPDTAITDIRIDKVFIGSCTNSRIEDLRAAADVVRGRQRAPGVRLAMVVPGSGLVKEQAEREGLDRVFKDAGFEWREPGCSMCLAMNADRLEPGERCASTSNRNFEGRQGKGGRTHLVSPKMAAAAAVEGHFVDIRDWS